MSQTLSDGRPPAATAEQESSPLRPLPPPGAIELPENRNYRWKTKLLGRPLHNDEAAHQRLGRPTALAVFASDALSSTAYATEEILRTLLLGGLGLLAFSYVVPITLAMVGVLVILMFSYRQTIKAYPSAGGAYIVTKDNLGLLPAQVAGVALLTDYILTVSVSVSAGVAALYSAFPALQPSKVPIAVGFIAVIAWGNLRGVKESGRIFAVPTYLFLISMFTMIGVGIAPEALGGLGTVTPADPAVLQQTSVASLFLLLHAFASGGAAMTGVEAISNGVPAFKPPEWKNARSTLMVMGTCLGIMFIGISWLAKVMQVVPSDDKTVLAQIAQGVFGAGSFGHVLFLVVQAATMLILVLAANTSFADFPRLASFHADDAFMPKQLTKRGHRLVFSNGILFLAVAAAVLVVIFRADVTHLIPLYAIGVFTSFTLSQAGMAVHHVKIKEEGWRVGLVINSVGAVATGLVTIVIAVSKFTHGAWFIMVLVPVLVVLLVRLNRQYEAEHEDLANEVQAAVGTPVLRRHTVLILVGSLDRSIARALQYARTLVPDELRAVHIASDPARAKELAKRWSELQLTRVPLELVECPDRRLDRALLEVVAAELDGRTEVTVLIPRREYAHVWHRLLHDRTSDQLAKAVAALPHANVTMVPYHMGEQTKEPERVNRVPIGGVRFRDYVRVGGRITTLRVVPWAGNAPVLECTVFDETGGLTLVFLGRRAIGGIELGRYLEAEGRAIAARHRLALMNPVFELFEDDRLLRSPEAPEAPDPAARGHRLRRPQRRKELAAQPG